MPNGNRVIISATLLGLAAGAAYCAPASVQVKSGGEVYARLCAGCHGPELAGGRGPPLRGAMFMQNWQHKTARKLYSKILTTMPSSAPGTLSSKTALDVTMYVLRQNDVAIGAQAKTSPDLLNHMNIAP